MSRSILLRTYVVVSLIVIALLAFFLVLQLNKQDKTTQDTESISALSMLEKSGYNIVETQIEIVNSGSVPGVVSDTILLSVDSDGKPYIKEPGDFDAGGQCINERANMIERLGGSQKAAGNGISSTLEGCKK